MRVWRQVGQQRMRAGINSRSQFGPVSSSKWRAAIVILAAYGLDFANAGTMIVHRLPHAAGMRQGGRDRHTNGDKDPREQKHQQQSGGQAIHGWITTAGTRIGDARPARKYLHQQSRGDSCPRLSGRAHLDRLSKHQQQQSFAPPDSRGPAVPAWSFGASTSSGPNPRHQ